MTQKTDWLTAKEAAAILSRNSDKPITPKYVYHLASRGRIRSQSTTSLIRSKPRYLYNRADIEAYHVEERGATIERVWKLHDSEQDTRKAVRKKLREEEH